ncbi:MAG: hypothetical protein WA860_06180, partial [Acidimicrobiales bacterium]
NDSVTFDVQFNPPGSSGDFDHYFNSLGTIKTSVGNFGIAITGSADPPAQIVTDPSTVSFGDVAVGSSATMNFELGDQGGFPLDITESTPPNPATGFSALTNPFTQLAPSPYQIAPNTSVEETVQFTPTADGNFSGTWLLEGNDGSGVQTVTLTGTGYTPTPGGGGGGGGGGTAPTTTTTIPPTTTTTAVTHRPTLTITTRSGHVGTTLTLRTSGDPTGGALTFHVHGGTAQCSVRGSGLSAKSPGTCVVTGKKAAKGMTAAVSSPATVINFARRVTHNSKTAR